MNIIIQYFHMFLINYFNVINILDIKLLCDLIAFIEICTLHLIYVLNIHCVYIIILIRRNL